MIRTEPNTVPPPVLDFFARFLANPEDKALRVLCVDLLDLEVSRADHNLFCDRPLAEASEAYKSDFDRADRALSTAIRCRWLRHKDLDLPHHWLTLMGHRLAIERGLAVTGIEALAHVAARRFNLRTRETETWPLDTLFGQYINTVLRDEWDYRGVRFRMPGET